MMAIEVSRKRRRGSPKRKWLDNTRNDLSERELSGDEAQCRVNGKRLIRNIDPTYNVKGCVWPTGKKVSVHVTIAQFYSKQPIIGLTQEFCWVRACSGAG